MDGIKRQEARQVGGCLPISLVKSQVHVSGRDPVDRRVMRVFSFQILNIVLDRPVPLHDGVGVVSGVSEPSLMPRLQNMAR